MGLVLSRKKNQSVVIRVGGYSCSVTLINLDGGKAKLAFDADDEVEIIREELLHEVRPQGLQKWPQGR